MLELFYYPGNASMAPHILLNELGVPFTLTLVDRAQNGQRSPDYLRLNPNGRIPVLVDGDLVLFETGAIVLHLVDQHASAGLAPLHGTAARAHFYKWLLWLGNTLQPELMLFFYPERWLPSDAAAAAALRRVAQTHVGEMLAVLTSELQRHGGDWLLGETYSALDGYALMLCRWTRDHAVPARAHPVLSAYLHRLLSRPAVQRTLRAEELPAPWI